jgi:hypothetical protein
MSDPVDPPPPHKPPHPGRRPFSWKFLTNNLRDIAVWCLLLAAFRVVPYLIQQADPTSAVSDFGMVHVLVYGSLGTSFAVMTVWIVFHFSFPTLSGYLDSGKFREDFHGVPSQHRIWFLVAVMGLLVWTFVKVTALGAGGDA